MGGGGYSLIFDNHEFQVFEKNHNQRTVDFNHFKNLDKRTNGFLGNSLTKLFLEFEKLQLYVRIKYLNFFIIIIIY